MTYNVCYDHPVRLDQVPHQYYKEFCPECLIADNTAIQARLVAAITERDTAFHVAENHKKQEREAVRIGCENIAAREKAERERDEIIKTIADHVTMRGKYMAERDEALFQARYFKQGQEDMEEAVRKEKSLREEAQKTRDARGTLMALDRKAWSEEREALKAAKDEALAKLAKTEGDLKAEEAGQDNLRRMLAGAQKELEFQQKCLDDAATLANQDIGREREAKAALAEKESQLADGRKNIATLESRLAALIDSVRGFAATTDRTMTKREHDRLREALLDADYARDRDAAMVKPLVEALAEIVKGLPAAIRSDGLTDGDNRTGAVTERNVIAMFASKALAIHASKEKPNG